MWQAILYGLILDTNSFRKASGADLNTPYQQALWRHRLFYDKPLNADQNFVFPFGIVIPLNFNYSLP